MKKSILLFGFSLTAIFGFTQSDVSGPGIGHQRAAGRFVGWSPTALGSVSGSLEIRNDFADDINFFTNSFQRMIIKDAGGANNAGRIAMGNNLPVGFVPNSRLHLHQNGGQNRIQFTNNNTGLGGGSGLQVGINNLGHALIRQREDLQMRFFTNNTERMFIDNGTGTGSGFVAFSENIAGFTPLDRLHLNQASGDVMTRYTNGNAPTGFRIGSQNNGVALLHQLDSNDILMRTTRGRLRMYGNNPPGGILPGLVRIGANNGFAPVLHDPRLLVVGSIQSGIDTGAYHVAEFRNEFFAGSSTGIKIRGSRNISGLLCSAHIDMSNFDSDELAGTEFIMARFGSDMETPTGQTGNLSIFTNSGIADTGLTQAIYVSSQQFSGFGDQFVYNTNPLNLPTERIDADGNARLRTLPTLPYKADTSVTQVVMVDTNGVLRWEFTDSLFANNVNIVANNGVSVDSGIVKLGVPCRDTAGNVNQAAIFANALTQDRVVAFRNHHLWFASLNADTAGVGIGGQPAFSPFCETGNTVEISANNKSKKYGNTNASGLRFTKLTANDTVVPHGINGVDSLKVLSVDEDGDVVLVNAFSGAGLANVTADNGLTINPVANNVQFGHQYIVGNNGDLIHDTEVPFNGFNVHFTNALNGGVPGINRYSFGQPVSLSGLAIESKVYSFNGDENSAIMGHTDGTLLNPSPLFPAYGVAGILENSHSERAAAVYGEAFNSINPYPGVGVWGVAHDNRENYGVRGTVDDNTAINNYGGDFNSDNAVNVNYGVSSRASGPAGSTNYGIWARSNGATGTNYAGWFEGDVFINSPTFGGFLVTPSDQQFKTNVNTISNANSLIAQLQPKEFYYDTSSYSQINFSGEKQYGLIAQEVEQILPELVTDNVFPAQYDSLGNQTSAAINYKALNYNAFIAILMKGMQEQQGVIDSLKNEMTTITNCLNNSNICSTGQRTNGDNANNENNGQTVELNNLNAIILDQNLPNPFAENTVINYNIPEDVSEAVLMFYDMNGRIIKQVEITERGDSKMTVYGDNLKNGIYTYSLIADGQLIATKKMVKQ